MVNRGHYWREALEATADKAEVPFLPDMPGVTEGALVKPDKMELPRFITPVVWVVNREKLLPGTRGTIPSLITEVAV